MKAPFPWFGGKSKAAPLIWSRLGADCGNYIEPFFGSGAVWHGRPAAFRGWATVNDLDGNLANGGNPKLRIALCGHAGEHEALQAHGWTVETWAKGGGYQGADDRERIWFSPACIGRVEHADLFTTDRP